MKTKTKSAATKAKHTTSAKKPVVKTQGKALPKDTKKDCCYEDSPVPHENIQTHAYYLSKERQHNGTPGCSNTDWHMAEYQLREKNKDYAI